jgi:hypothetical protein
MNERAKHRDLKCELCFFGKKPIDQEAWCVPFAILKPKNRKTEKNGNRQWSLVTALHCNESCFSRNRKQGRSPFRSRARAHFQQLEGARLEGHHLHLIFTGISHGCREWAPSPLSMRVAARKGGRRPHRAGSIDAALPGCGPRSARRPSRKI